MRVLIAALLLAGCAHTEVIPSQRPVPVFPEPAPAIQHDYSWIVITKDNATAILNSLPSDVVLYAVTADGYSALNMNQAELRRYIQQERSVNQSYRLYLQAPNP